MSGPESVLRVGEYEKNLIGRQEFQTFAGSDIQAVMYLPLLTKKSYINGSNENPKFKIFADLQTISISSTRSVSPVRVFGRSSPIGYTRGARTFAGSLIFATIKKDPFNDVVDVGVGESYVNATTSLVADQLPPFSVIITAANEAGAAASQIIHGITITNYGTTYSVDDLYTETTYTYVATDVVPLTSKKSRQELENEVAHIKSTFNTVTKLVEDSLGKAYGKLETAWQQAQAYGYETKAIERGMGKTYALIESSIQNARTEREILMDAAYESFGDPPMIKPRRIIKR